MQKGWVLLLEFKTFDKRNLVIYNRLFLEWEIKEILVEMYNKYYIKSIDFIDKVEIMAIFEDLEIIHKCINQWGIFDIAPEVLEENKENDFISLLIKYFEISRKIEVLDEYYVKNIKGTNKQGIHNIKNKVPFIKREIDEIVMSGVYEIDQPLEIEANLGYLGFIGKFYVDNIKQNPWCPIYEITKQLGIFPERYKKQRKYGQYSSNIVVTEIEDIENRPSLVNKMRVVKAGGYAKGKLITGPVSVDEWLSEVL